MRTNLKGFADHMRRKNWSGLWVIDGHELSDREAHIFVERAIAEGYECDVDVPDDKVREWLGLSRKD